MVLRDLHQRWHLLPAFRNREWAARMEAAARRRRRGVGHEAFDGAQALLLEMQARDRAEQSDGIWVLRLREYALDGAALHHLPRVHHDHVVGELGDHAEI